jgi:hypothetical protein
MRITMSTAVCPPRSAAGASAPALTCSRPSAARDVHIRPRRLPPECLDGVEALADKHGIDRDFARRMRA